MIGVKNIFGGNSGPCEEITRISTSAYYDYFNPPSMHKAVTYYFKEWEGDLDPAHSDTPNEYRIDRYCPDLQFKVGHIDRSLEPKYDLNPLKFPIEVISAEGTQNFIYTVGKPLSISTSADNFAMWYVEEYADPNWLPGFIKSSNVTIGLRSHIPKRMIAVYKLIDVYCTNCTLNGNHETQVNADEEHEVSLDYDVLNENQRIEDWEITGPAELISISEDLSTIRIKTHYDDAYNTTDITIKPIIKTHTGYTVKLYAMIENTGEMWLYDTVVTTSYESVFQTPVGPENTTFLGWYTNLNTFDTITSLDDDTTIRISYSHTCMFKVDKDMSITAVYSKMPDVLNNRHMLIVTGWDDEYDDRFTNTFDYYGSTQNKLGTKVISCEVGTTVKLTFDKHSTCWFMQWTGDVDYIYEGAVTDESISISMPDKDIHIHANVLKYNGTYDRVREVRVLGGYAKQTYPDKIEGTTIYVDASELILSVDVLPSKTVVPNFKYDHMVINHRYPYGNVLSEHLPFNDRWGEDIEDYIQDGFNGTHDIEVYLSRRHVLEFTVYTTNATGPGTVYAGTYPITAALTDTENERYRFNKWICKDVNGTDQSKCIQNVNSLTTTITLSDRNLYAIADYTTYYKLTVINGQDSGTGYYSAGTIINTVTANDPVNEMQMFDHWDDPVGIIEDIYDPTPTITMKDSIATITAVYANIGEITDNSILITDKQLTEEIMLRDDLDTVSGVATIGTLVFDKDGSIGVITNLNEDQLEDTRDYTIKKLFYGDDVEWLTT